ncbi:adenine specific DNA methylase Mod [Desulfosporosinus acidiphilus SJ4]|uniref:Adenine specific DNA methylase Mod n=1 Tax=Desulfosporosinus acidiphilus (strain DSM 22704 / JCM 16185 / SJ4) TaxID=646529 RepID=I4D484_DESAJ|nr:site-specific DNA-methyltransferase [Desulfosporosinus acidiphilus]AFM40608.1 adenine specific DNA methylase Mod [Desulfosporosinus acidiphilus SJ4]
MEKLNLESSDIIQKNIEIIGSLFPNVITERRDKAGNITKGINFKLLKQELSGDVIDGEECYEFTWVGKKAAIVEANKPIRKTLRPCFEESKSWKTTGNLYIEGDNLEVLKLMQAGYLNSIQVIYIDPPYNTGKDFIYKDSFKMDRNKYEEQMGLYDEKGCRLFQNTVTNGRFHSDWCSMIYPRLRLAHRLLKEDGVMFISISDLEVDNLKKIGNEVFGEENFLADIIWQSTKSVTNTAIISVSHTHNLVYFKSMDYYVKHREKFRLAVEGEGFANPDNDPRGKWKADPFQVGGWRPNQQYEIVNPKTGVVYKPNANCSWKNDYHKFQELLKDQRIVFGKTGEGAPQRKRFIWEAEERGKVAKTIWNDIETTTNGTQLIKKIFAGLSIFDNPKPVELIKRFLKLATNPQENCMILDFFSGSATTAQAVMELNAEDQGNRKFIMVQLQEPCNKESEAFKVGYKNICEIGKERIHRAGEMIVSEYNDKETINTLDIGFRVFKLDSTNMKDVYYAASDYHQAMLEGLESNIKDDRTDLDLLYSIILDWGLPLTLNHNVETIAGKAVHMVEKDLLAACFADKISETVIREIAQRKPRLAVFRDSSFTGSADKINLEAIFKFLAPNTSVKVI